MGMPDVRPPAISPRFPEVGDLTPRGQLAVHAAGAGITLNSTNVPSLQIIWRPWFTVDGWPDASIHAPQP